MIWAQNTNPCILQKTHNSRQTNEQQTTNTHQGVPVPGMTASLGYFDTYRRERLPANLVQAQRDFFGSHTYQRDDTGDAWHHTLWDPNFSSSDSITTGNYNA
jgi:6-phosphogluconate dehydrogenase